MEVSTYFYGSKIYASIKVNFKPMEVTWYIPWKELDINRETTWWTPWTSPHHQQPVGFKHRQPGSGHHPTGHCRTPLSVTTSHAPSQASNTAFTFPCRPCTGPLVLYRRSCGRVRTSLQRPDTQSTIARHRVPIHDIEKHALARCCSI